MNQFKRAIQLILFIFGAIAGILAALAAFFARFVIRPPRQPLWADPKRFGMEYEDVQFPARDGVRIAGWFIPTAGSAAAPTLLLIHGWGWNRLGTVPANLLDDFPGSSPLEILPLAHNLRQEGFNLLMIDLRSHGISANSGAITFGWNEANDVLGAIDYLAKRDDIDQDKIGVIGFSMGANAALFALPRAQKVKGAILAQPTTPTIFNRGYTTYLLGGLGSLLAQLMRVSYPFLAAGLRLSAIDPIFAASGAGETPLLFIQSKGDRWGNPEDVAQMAAAAPHANPPLWVDGERFDGYRYLVDNPQIAIEFFEPLFG